MKDGSTFAQLLDQVAATLGFEPSQRRLLVAGRRPVMEDKLRPNMIHVVHIVACSHGGGGSSDPASNSATSAPGTSGASETSAARPQALPEQKAFFSPPSSSGKTSSWRWGSQNG